MRVAPLLVALYICLSLFFFFSLYIFAVCFLSICVLAFFLKPSEVSLIYRGIEKPFPPFFLLTDQFMEQFMSVFLQQFLILCSIVPIIQFFAPFLFVLCLICHLRHPHFSTFQLYFIFVLLFLFQPAPPLSCVPCFLIVSSHFPHCLQFSDFEYLIKGLFGYCLLLKIL